MMKLWGKNRPIQGDGESLARVLGYLREINLRNAKRILLILTSDQSFEQKKRIFKKALKAINLEKVHWRPRNLIEEHPDKSSSSPRVLYVFHIFYPEYVDRVLGEIQRFEGSLDFRITTPSEQIHKRLISELSSLENVDKKIILTPNVGRNFGPLLVEFRDEIKKFEYLIHLHSKKSLHIKKHRATSWSDRNWKLLLEDKDLVRRSLEILQRNSDVGILYSDTTDILNLENYSWGENYKFLSKITLNQDTPREHSHIAFPAGGMFAARVDGLLGLLQNNFSYDMFPVEKSQLDGTMQHAIERVIGTEMTARRLRHAIYYPKENAFSSDLGFLEIENDD